MTMCADKGCQKTILRVLIMGWCRDADLAEAAWAVMAGGSSARAAARKWNVGRTALTELVREVRGAASGIISWAVQDDAGKGVAGKPGH